MSTLVTLGPQYFPLTSVGAPAGAGSLYIGDVDTDPEISGNQKAVSALTEDGDLIVITQPIDLSAGGIPLYLGSPVSLYVTGNYSLKVLDINDAQVYYVPNTPGVVLAEDVEIGGDLDVGGDITSEEWPVNNNIAQFDGNNPAGLEDSGESIPEIGVLDTPAEWTAQQTSDETAITSTSNATAWNVNTAQAARHVLTENTTIGAPSNLKIGGYYSLLVVQAAGVYTLAWNAIFDWGAQSAPDAPAADGDQILFTFYYDGTNMLGVESHVKEA